jgi:hypothetical protein
MRLADAALESAATDSDATDSAATGSTPTNRNPTNSALGNTAPGNTAPKSSAAPDSATAGNDAVNSGTDISGIDSVISGDVISGDDTVTSNSGSPLADDTALDSDAIFRIAVAGFEAGREAVLDERDDITFEDSPAPRRLAPFATAIGAIAHHGDGQAGDGEAGTGRLVLLYDPDGQEGWTGVFRLVAYVRADIEEEMAADPLLGEVGWSWLTDALELHAPGYSAPSGTVTRVITESFGSKSGELPATGFELRASWSPPQDDDLGVNVMAWCDLLVAAAGLPVQPPGTKALRPGGPRSGQRRRR